MTWLDSWFNKFHHGLFTDSSHEIDLACKEHVGDSDSENQSDSEANERLRRPYSPSGGGDVKYKPKAIKGR